MTKDKKQIGGWGEDIAAQYLQDLGFQILHRNYHIGPYGEIDIIARNAQFTIFVEVKSGNSKFFGPAEYRVTGRKRRQLHRLASQFIGEYPELDTDFRLDVVIVDGTESRYKIRYYPDAFSI